MNINTLLESANPYKSLQDDASRLASKWAKTGLLEGMTGENDKNNMSMILENQAKQLVLEQSSTGTGASFTPSTGAQWAGVALPLVRKVFGQLAAKEFVSVQPMNLPSGLVFFLDFQYGTGKTPFAAGESLYGDTTSSGDPTGGLYGAGRYTYSENHVSISGQVALTQNAVSGINSITTASWSNVDYDGDYSASFSTTAGQDGFKKVAIAAASFSADYDSLGVKGFRAFSASNGTTTAGAVGALGKLLPQFTEKSGSSIVFIYSASGAVGATMPTSSFYVEYTLNPNNAANRGDFEDRTGGASVPNTGSTTTIQIPEINVQMNSEAIVAKTRKLKAKWTPEFAQDLNAYHSLDAEAELTSIMSEYISLEIDLEILSMLIENAAAATEVWDARNNVAINFNTGITDSDLGFYNTQGGWFQTLGTKVQKVSNIIHQKTLRGGANFMVVSPSVSTVIESIPGYASNSDGDANKAKYAFGVQKAGQLNGRYTVYKNPYMTENVILVGYRGSQFLETGTVFAPYIPLIMTPLIYDPDTFTPRKGLLTRYAKKMVRPEFYGKIYVSGLNTI